MKSSDLERYLSGQGFIPCPDKHAKKTGPGRVWYDAAKQIYVTVMATPSGEVPQGALTRIAAELKVSPIELRRRVSGKAPAIRA